MFFHGGHAKNYVPNRLSTTFSLRLYIGFIKRSCVRRAKFALRCHSRSLSALAKKAPLTRCFNHLAGVAGLEPTHAGFRIPCLTNLAIPQSAVNAIIIYSPISFVKKNLRKYAFSLNHVTRDAIPQSADSLPVPPLPALFHIGYFPHSP